MWPTCLSFYVILLTFVLPTVHSLPWLIASVDLRVCTTDTPTASGYNECASVCEPIRLAQEICHGDTACTCSTAPPPTVNSCLECHIERRDEFEPQWISASDSARDTYSQLCSKFVPIPPKTITPSSSPSLFSNTTSSDTPHSHSRREAPQYDDYCIYGFPVITWRFPQSQELSPIINDHSLFLSIFFVIAVAICIIQNRRHSS